MGELSHELGIAPGQARSATIALFTLDKCVSNTNKECCIKKHQGYRLDDNIV